MKKIRKRIRICLMTAVLFWCIAAVRFPEKLDTQFFRHQAEDLRQTLAKVGDLSEAEAYLRRKLPVAGKLVGYTLMGYDPSSFGIVTDHCLNVMKLAEAAYQALYTTVIPGNISGTG